MLSPDQSNMAVEAMGVRVLTENIPVSQASKSHCNHCICKLREMFTLCLLVLSLGLP